MMLPDSLSVRMYYFLYVNPTSPRKIKSEAEEKLKHQEVCKQPMHLDSRRFSNTLSASSFLPDSNALTLGLGSAAAVENLHVRLSILGMVDQMAAPGLLAGFPGSSLYYGQMDGKIMARPFLDGSFDYVHGVAPLSKEAV